MFFLYLNNPTQQNTNNYQNMIANQPNKIPTSPPNNHITTESYHNLMTIKLITKTHKCILYQCQFVASQQKVTIKLINMEHINMIYNTKLLTQQICVRPDYQCVGFFDRTKDEMLGRFLMEIALMRLQEDADCCVDRREVKDSRRYFYGADGVLYSNFIIYSKPYERQFYQILQRQKRTLSQLQQAKLRNQLTSLHFQQLTYSNLSSASIVFIPDNEGMNKRKLSPQEMADYQMMFTPVLKINSNVQPIHTVTKNSVQIDLINQQQLEQLAQIMQTNIQTNTNQCQSTPVQILLQQPKETKKNSNTPMSVHYHINRYNNSSRSSVSYAAFASLQRILQIPKLYMLIEQTPTIQKFQQEVQKIRKTKLNQAQLQWYLAKYLEITYMNNNGNTVPTPSTARNNYSSTISMRNELQNTMSKSWNTTNNMYNLVSACSLANMGNPSNQQLQLLFKEYKNLTQDRYRPAADNEGLLGWGDLTIRYHYSANNSTYPAYIKALQKYTKQLYKQINFKKCRKMYHFYTAKLLETQSKYNEAILHLKQAFKIIINAKPQKITQNYFNSDKYKKCQLAVVCHQLGRLHVEIKRYKQALKWYDDCLKVKEDAYGRCSIEMLTTLYNIIYVLLHYQIDQPPHPITITNKKVPNTVQDASNKLPHLLPYYLHLLSETKHRIPNQQALAEWVDSLTIRQQLSINLITTIENKLTDLYHDPWRDSIISLFASKIGKYRSSVKGQGVLGGSSEAQILRKVDDISGYSEVSHRNQQQIVSWACTQILTINPKNINQTIQQHCSPILKFLQQYTNIPLNPQTFYIIYTLKQHLILVSTYIQHKQSNNNNKCLTILIECINNIKNLHQYIKQTSTNTPDDTELQQLKQSIVDMIYGLYQLIINSQHNGQLQIDWKWMLSQYYQYGNPQTNRIANRRQQSIKHVLQYCLLMHKYYQDYGRIYNSLINSKAIKAKKIDTLWQYQVSYVVYHYLLSICLIQMHRYGQAIGSINSVLQSKCDSNNQSNQIFELLELLPKKMIYRHEFIYMLLHCYYKMRNHLQFIQLFEKQQLSTIKTNITDNQSDPQQAMLGKQNKCIINMAIIVYHHQSAQQNTQYATLDLLSALQSSYQQPSKLVLKILLTSPKKLLQYITNVTSRYKLSNPNIISIQQTPSSPTTQISPQSTILLDILQQNNGQQTTNIRIFYQQAIHALVDLYRSSRKQQQQEICLIIQQLLADVFMGFQSGQIDKQRMDKSRLSLEMCNKTIELSMILRNQLTTTNNIQSTSIFVSLFNKITTTYFPIIIQTLQHYQTSYNSQYHIHHTDQHKNKSTHISVSIFNHRYKLQILQIFEVLMCWFRRSRMYRQVVFCRIFLYACGRGMCEVNQLGWNEEINQICQILGLSSINQTQQIQQARIQKITCPETFIKFQLHKYLSTLIQNMQEISYQCHEYRQGYIIFVQSQTQTTSIDQNNLDEHLGCIQNMLLLLEGLKLNLGNLLPNGYMDEISSGVLTQIKDKLEMS